MSDPSITSTGAEDAANSVIGDDTSNEDALVYYVIFSGILAGFGAACQIWFQNNQWIKKAADYHGDLVSNFFPLTIGYIFYLAFPDTPLVTSAMLYLIATSVEGPWWDLWQTIAKTLRDSDTSTHKDGKLTDFDYKEVMFYIVVAVQSTLTLIMMFVQAFLLPKVYDWADAQEKFAPIYM